MTSHTPSHNQLVAQLKAHALAAVGRRAPNLVTHLEAGRSETDHLRMISNSGMPPAALRDALRAPAGTQRLVCLRVNGRSIRTVINPLGYEDPVRLHAVWAQICSLTPNRAAA